MPAHNRNVIEPIGNRPGWGPERASHADWSDAKFFDKHLPDGLVLRALVCLLENGEWQWSLTVLGEGKGEMISTGTDKTAALARQAAIAEIAKCLEYPMIA